MITSLRKAYPIARQGRGTYGDPVQIRYGGDRHVYIGNYCSFGAGVVILPGGEHHLDWVANFPAVIRLDVPGGTRRQRMGTSKGDVRIGSDVWVGRETLILSGVTIGHGAVIGARSVVARDVPSYAIWAGNPARQIRWRFDEPTREALLAVAWWDWPEERIRRYALLLNQPDVGEFLRVAREEDANA